MDPDLKLVWSFWDDQNPSDFTLVLGFNNLPFWQAEFRKRCISFTGGLISSKDSLAGGDDPLSNVTELLLLLRSEEGVWVRHPDFWKNRRLQTKNTWSWVFTQQGNVSLSSKVSVFDIEVVVLLVCVWESIRWKEDRRLICLEEVVKEKVFLHGFLSAERSGQLVLNLRL